MSHEMFHSPQREIENVGQKSEDILEWPTDDMIDIPDGTYVSSSSIGSSNGDHAASSASYGRVLLYVTSHMSEEHAVFLKYCWSNILARSTLLREADVAVYLNPSDETKRKEAMDLVASAFSQNPSFKVYLRQPQWKAGGATAALFEAITSNFFSGYDWVIRLNPDVIIRDDSFLIEKMADPTISALLINCSRKKIKAHTDFFVIRPGALDPDSIPVGGRPNAEQKFTALLQGSGLFENKNSYRWIHNAGPISASCRSGYGKDYYDTPIVHEHAFHPDMCYPIDFDLSEVFSHKWPWKWKPV